MTANVVALDQPLMFNRLGAQNVNGLMYALRHDVVDKNTGLTEPAGTLAPGQVELRPDKRPRPLVLRVAKGDCLQVNLQNLLDPVANPNNADHPALNINDQVEDRHVGFSAVGLSLVNGIADSGSNVGSNASSLLNPGEQGTFTFLAEEEGGYMVYSLGAPLGSEGSGGNVGSGLWATIMVEPANARFYRSQVTEEDLRLATDPVSQMTPAGQPIIDYDAVYPNAEPWISEGKAGTPILAMIDGSDVIRHSDLTAIIAGPNPDGSFPPSTYPLEASGKRNPALPNRLEAFREFAAIFHDDTVAAQAFPGWFEDPVFEHTFHGVRDAFMMNYGSAGIGSQLVANRLRVGAQHDCLNCAYEEFFLSSHAVGDPAMVVDVPANTGLEACTPNNPTGPECGSTGPKASKAYYPDDPSNVYHSYLNDFVKFRSLHAGPKEHHIFHLHNHQWLYNPDDDTSNYLDAQAEGPGSSYTFEIAFGGAGNRNQSAGDAIFHCHFYPHFAQGMWSLWRIHDVFEKGTELSASQTGTDFHDDPFELRSGQPASGSRAYPDGEIVSGTPIPAVVPLPGKALAPMPGNVTVAAVDKDGDSIPESSQAVLDLADTDPALVDMTPVVDEPGAPEMNPDGLKNPGYPFWIAGIDQTVGQRSTTPPLDMLPSAGGHHGGLPRHLLDGYAAGGEAVSIETRLDFSKDLEKAKMIELDEYGTPFERAAMSFHSKPSHPSWKLDLAMNASPADFRTNGTKPRAGAPYFDGCRDDQGNPTVAGGVGKFWAGVANQFFDEPIQYGADNPRVYKAANIQTDVVFNKAGYHFPQQRLLTLWHDVLPTLDKTRPPEPFVMRLNSLDCAVYLQTNLVPEYYELDDYQVRTPTDVIGQHIHLPKWDLVASDGAANGWNYEDGALAAETVVQRIEAINAFEIEEGGVATLAPEMHPFPDFQRPEWAGARTVIQRWFVDPLHNMDGFDRGLGITFTHDHYAPSTHQQIGLYATLLIEPKGSTWKHNETGVAFYTRDDGGPTSWQAIIEPGDINGDGTQDDYREFFLEFADFQHAYEPGVFVGVDENGGISPPNTETFRDAVNPTVRIGAPFPDLVEFAPTCPGGQPRPCPEAISADDPGMYVVNYRNEPLAHRVFDPDKLGPDGKKGAQADGLGGDLAYAFHTRTDRAMPEQNTITGLAPYPPLTQGKQNGDPFTPVMRVIDGDVVRLRVQAGAQEEEHTTAINGMKWLKEGGSFGQSMNSGWKAADFVGLSEKLTLATPARRDLTQSASMGDHLWSVSNAQEGLWNGMWGVIRTYDSSRPDLASLPNNVRPSRRPVENVEDFDGLCPVTAETVAFDVTAVAVNDVMATPANVTVVPTDSSATMHMGALPKAAGGSLVYNSRTTTLEGGKSGPLHDPTAMMYVLTDDLEANPANSREQRVCFPRRGGEVGAFNMNCPVKLKDTVTPKPLTLRAKAGQCIQVTLRNRLPAQAYDLAGYVSLPPIVMRDKGQPGEGAHPFDNNLIRPSSHVGLHPQLVEYDVTRDDGTNVGINPVQTIAPGGIKVYRWYAGDIIGEGSEIDRATGLPAGAITLSANPVEYGVVNLQPADKIKQSQKGLFGALVIEPGDATWTEDGVGNSLSADVLSTLHGPFREHVLAFQKGVALRYADSSPVETLGSNAEMGDPEDSGQYAVNYRTEPLWFRFGLPGGADFGGGHPAEPGVPAETGMASLLNAHQAFSNTLVGGDPETPVLTSAAGEDTRIRLTMPGGVGRGIVFGMQGHNWQRNPYLDGAVPSQTIGEHDFAIQGSTVEGIMSGHHHNFLVESGGANAVPGDYLYRDHASFGTTNGLWGLLRVEPGQP